MEVIRFSDVWEMYKMKFVIDEKTVWDNFWALKGINLSIVKGETVGIIGENGAGKSTTLKLIAGMLKPDRGTVTVSGRACGLLELGAGFQSELTGQENISLNLSLFGLAHSVIDEKFQAIVDFASIGKFIYAPVKCYSQGMFVRLAFAVAVHTDPDILLIDDTLAVGDEFFQKKCVKKIFELRDQGKTIVFVTHDMTMLRRLCMRTILLKQGNLVKDDTTTNVLPLYTLLVGAKEGIGTLQKGSLMVVFNNGKLFFYWEKVLLTPEYGLYASFLVENRWYTTLEAEWEVEVNDNTQITAKGTFYRLGLIQIWKLLFHDNYEISIEIEVQNQESIYIQDGRINVMVTTQYEHWLIPEERGDFPAIHEEDKNWQIVANNQIGNKVIAVRGPESKDILIPSFIFERLGGSSQGYSQVYNTDYFTHCRVLQLQADVNSSSEYKSKSFVYFSGKVSLAVSDINAYLMRRSNESVLLCGDMKILFTKGRCSVFYKDIPLTKSNHIGVLLYLEERKYLSDQAYWEFEKKGENILIARCSWKNLPLVYIWEIEILEDFSCVWRMKMEVLREISIPQQSFVFNFSEKYTYYSTSFDRGLFPDDFSDEEVDMVRQCVVCDPIMLQGANENLPDISLQIVGGKNNFIKIFNTDMSRKARRVLVERVESEDHNSFLPGIHECFAVKMNVGKKNSVPVVFKTVSLQSDVLKFSFDNGRGVLQWGEKQLTTKMGFYTSLFWQKRWFDSQSQAVWEIKEKKEKFIVVLGKWRHLPISQIWSIYHNEKNVFEVNIAMQVHEEISFDCLQTNIMLSERYNKWFTQSDQGSFPEFKGDIDDNWDIVWPYSSVRQSQPMYVGVSNQSLDKTLLPGIKLFCHARQKNERLNVVNSDLYYRGRVLRCSQNEKTFFLPGQYQFYTGKIEVDPLIS